MLPMGYCAFDPEHAYSFNVHVLGQVTTVNAAVVFSLLFVIIGTWAVLILTNQLQ